MGPNLHVRLYILRNIQLLFTVIYVALMAYAALNPGIWLDLKEPLGFGFSCSFLTILATVPCILWCYRFPAEEIRKIYYIECFQTLHDSILFSLWIITFIFMRSEHGDSDLPGLGDPPELSWHFGVILVAFEAILFGATTIMLMAPHFSRSLAGEDPFEIVESVNFADQNLRIYR